MHCKHLYNVITLPFSYQTPRNQYQEYDNLAVAFRFMSETENIRLEGIGETLQAVFSMCLSFSVYKPL